MTTKTQSRDQPVKLPRYSESRPLQETSTSSDVISDVIVHRVPPQHEPKPPAPHAVANDASRSMPRSGATSKDHTQRGGPNAAVSQKQTKHSKPQENAAVNSSPVSVEIKQRQTSSTVQPAKPLNEPSRVKPVQVPAKPHSASREPVSNSATKHKSTPTPTVGPVTVTQFKPVAGQQPRSAQSLHPEQVKPKQAAVTGAKDRDMSSVSKSESIKSSPVNVQCKPRRQTRATLAYDRVMFFSDFFRRLESDRRLFALPPIRRNRVYVRPRAEDASPAPVKFPRPPATKKGRIGVVTATRNSGTSSSPFAVKQRRIPMSHAWDHKIDLASIEADATTSTAQPCLSQLHSTKQHLVPSASTKERPKPFSERSIDHRERETMRADKKRAVATDNAESAFIGVTKHSVKTRRRLKRKQRKRSVATGEGTDGGVHETSTTGSDEDTPSRQTEDRSRRGNRKEFRSPAEHDRPTSSSYTAELATAERARTPPQDSQKTRVQDIIRRPTPRIELQPTRSPTCVEQRGSRVSECRGKTMVEILSHIGEQTSNQTEVSASPKPDVTENQRDDDCPVSIVLDVFDADEQRTPSTIISGSSRGVMHDVADSAAGLKTESKMSQGRQKKKCLGRHDDE